VQVDLGACFGARTHKRTMSGARQCRAVLPQASCGGTAEVAELLPLELGVEARPLPAGSIGKRLRSLVCRLSGPERSGNEAHWTWGEKAKGRESRV
jgi:hypothetical protein